jgi:hypothetical protein
VRVAAHDPTCQRCGLDAQSLDVRVILPDPVLAMPVDERASRTWGGDPLLQVDGAGAFVRRLLLVHLTGGLLLTFGTWPPYTLTSRGWRTLSGDRQLCDPGTDRFWPMPSSRGATAPWSGRGSRSAMVSSCRTWWRVRMPCWAELSRRSGIATVCSCVWHTRCRCRSRDASRRTGRPNATLASRRGC